MILLLDNFDSFTFILKDYLLQLGKECLVIRNDENPTDYRHKDFEALLVSPGPQKPADANNLMAFISHFVSHTPILGVCLGHQAIVEYFGGTLKKMSRPEHGQLFYLTHNSDGIFQNCDSPIAVARYHSWCVDQLPEELLETAQTKEGVNMAIKHTSLPITGIQFHPESILTKHGLIMLQNWLQEVNQFNNS